MLATSGGTVLQRSSVYTSAALLSNDQTLVSTYIFNYTSFYVILTNIALTAPSNNIISYYVTGKTASWMVFMNQIQFNPSVT